MTAQDSKLGDTDDKIFVGKGDEQAWLTLALANRHGLVTGATGTGKTVSLQVMAEGFARAGVPVFASDIKGDLSGISEVGEAKDFIVKRATEMGLTFQPDQFSTVFWDVFGEQGHPVRATVTEMGPLLLARMLDLNDVQEGVLNVAFRVADDNGLTLIDMKDLRALLDAIVPDAGKKGADAEESPLADIKKEAQGFGNVTKATVGTIQRQLLVLENQGGTKFFGEPALTLKDFMKTDRDGRGMVNILVADKLLQSPRLYATFLLWMLSELFEELPEAGDLPKPKLVFFFDEAHLLFNDAPKALMDKIEQVVRLIRSKGVGVYFVTQNPVDVPDRVLGQLGNRVQHALRAFTPRDQKAVAAAAQTFRPNPKLDTAKVIMELGKGEALVSFLEGNGTPTMVERVMIRPPSARIGSITPEERKAIMDASPVKGKYDTAVDAESAYEMIQKRIAGTAATADAGAADGGGGGILGQIGSMVGTIFGTQRQARPPVGGPGHCARRDAIGHRPGDRGDGGQSRQIGRRPARWLDRPHPGARRARRAAASLGREARFEAPSLHSVMAGLVPAIHALLAALRTWMPGPSPRRSGFGRAGGTIPGMTRSRECLDAIAPHAGRGRTP
ncbi:DNA helicase HerA-like ATPase [Bradyrhizobium sp. i1.3.1]